VIARVVAGVLAGGLVVVAAAFESDTAKLSPQRTAAQVARTYGTPAKASCHEKHQGYWTYVCKVHQPARSFTVDVRVDENSIVDRTRR
jgi:invasion protein IalB